MVKHVTQLTLWLLCCFSLCIFTLGISWKLNVFINFGYQQIYSALSIDKTIEKYATLNRFERKDFVETKTQQHVSLFKEIVESINHSGKGLAEITYRNNSEKEKLLLTNAEVLHLEDVSILVDDLSRLWLINNILLVLFLFYFYFQKQSISTQSKKWLLCSFTLFLVLGFSILGFTRIFYYLHTVVFPDDHQWFFYYEDSLMSTLMKAPDLFAVIALLIILLALPIYILVYKLIFSKRYNLINLIKRIDIT
ncbi:MAG: DUF1461 domain-containing protein [Colwellia sp.]|nr:DUF1461 domain-containing protein [Colwellia sp.]